MASNHRAMVDAELAHLVAQRDVDLSALDDRRMKWRKGSHGDMVQLGGRFPKGGR